MERLSFQALVSLVDEPHVNGGVQVSGESEHALLGRVHWQIQQGGGVEGHGGENGPHHVAHYRHGGLVRAKDVVTSLLVRNYGRFCDVDVQILEHVSTIAEIEQNGVMAILGQAVRLHVQPLGHLVHAHQGGGVDCDFHVTEPSWHDRYHHRGSVLGADEHKELVLTVRCSRTVRINLQKFMQFVQNIYTVHTTIIMGVQN